MAVGESWLVNQEEIMQQLHAAVALHNQGELDQAETIYRNVLAVDANNFYALNFCGCVLRSKGRLEDARLLLQRAVSVKPGEISAQYNLGNVYRDLSRHAEAISHYAAALEIDPSDHSVLYEFANSCRILGDSPRAISSYRKAIDAKPDSADAYLNLGSVLTDEGEVEDAILSYQKAIEVKPDFAKAYLQLATLLHQEDELDDALALYALAFEIDNQMSDCRFHLCAGGRKKFVNDFEEMQSKMVRLSRLVDTLLREDFLLIRCIFSFFMLCDVSLKPLSGLGARVILQSLSRGIPQLSARSLGAMPCVGNHCCHAGCTLSVLPLQHY